MEILRLTGFICFADGPKHAICRTRYLPRPLSNEGDFTKVEKYMSFEEVEDTQIIEALHQSPLSMSDLESSEVVVSGEIRQIV